MSNYANREYIIKVGDKQDINGGYPLAEKPIELIRCKDCKWWERKGKECNYGYCHACKHGHYSDHWEIQIYRTYRKDWFCADGEKRT